MNAKVNGVFTKMMVEKVKERRDEPGFVPPWRKAWCGNGGGRPANLISGKPYRGINVFLTAMSGFGNPYFLSKKQAAELGATLKTTRTVHLVGPFLPTAGLDVEVPAAQSYTPISFFKFPTRVDKERAQAAGRREPGAFQIFYQVYNVEQFEGGRLADHKRMKELRDPKNAREVFKPEAAEAIYQNMPLRPTLEHGGDSAFYSPSRDHVQVPHQEDFEGDEEYYGTLFHELGHSTGHSKRLDRDEVTNHARFGDHRYSEEELVAEMTAAMLASEVGLGTSALLDNSAAYLDSWLKKIEGDPNMLFLSASKAQKAVDYITGYKWEEPKKEEVAK